MTPEEKQALKNFIENAEDCLDQFKIRASFYPYEDAAFFKLNPFVLGVLANAARAELASASRMQPHPLAGTPDGLVEGVEG